MPTSIQVKAATEKYDLHQVREALVKELIESVASYMGRDIVTRTRNKGVPRYDELLTEAEKNNGIFFYHNVHFLNEYVVPCFGVVLSGKHVKRAMKRVLGEQWDIESLALQRVSLDALNSGGVDDDLLRKVPVILQDVYLGDESAEDILLIPLWIGEKGDESEMAFRNFVQLMADRPKMAMAGDL